jgi:hypothetical protein
VDVILTHEHAAAGGGVLGSRVFGVFGLLSDMLLLVPWVWVVAVVWLMVSYSTPRRMGLLRLRHVVQVGAVVVVVVLLLLLLPHVLTHCCTAASSPRGGSKFMMYIYMCDQEWDGNGAAGAVVDVRVGCRMVLNGVECGFRDRDVVVVQ